MEKKTTLVKFRTFFLSKTLRIVKREITEWDTIPKSIWETILGVSDKELIFRIFGELQKLQKEKEESPIGK